MTRRDLEGARGRRATVVCASTGNTAASAAAYAARAGLRRGRAPARGAVAAAKVAQAGALGARVVEVRGSFDDALDGARELADRGTHVLVNSLNPDRIEGQKTAAFEIVEELGGAPDVLALPVRRRRQHPRVRPRVRRGRRGYAAARRRRGSRARGRRSPRRSASSSPPTPPRRLRPARVGRKGRVARRRGDSPGLARPRRTRRVSSANRRRRPGSRRSSSAGVEPGPRVVCVLTGHGLKDSEAAARESAAPVVVDADPDAIAEAAS